tara:strand:- start:15 stop:248 length:234 start_codon:yes stop_codon:yes gene_type:complete
MRKEQFFDKEIMSPESGSMITDERLEEIAKIFIENDIGIDEVLETIIESNGYVGVGLVTFGDYLRDYVMDKIKSVNN